tara:strand:- start:634 stop:1902 length:1269 start_codon:yes stop_codon:yes gene_type:complete
MGYKYSPADAKMSAFMQRMEQTEKSPATQVESTKEREKRLIKEHPGLVNTMKCFKGFCSPDGGNNSTTSTKTKKNKSKDTRLVSTESIMKRENVTGRDIGYSQYSGGGKLQHTHTTEKFLNAGGDKLKLGEDVKKTETTIQPRKIASIDSEGKGGYTKKTSQMQHEVERAGGKIDLEKTGNTVIPSEKNLQAYTTTTTVGRKTNKKKEKKLKDKEYNKLYSEYKEGQASASAVDRNWRTNMSNEEKAKYLPTTDAWDSPSDTSEKNKVGDLPTYLETGSDRRAKAKEKAANLSRPGKKYSVERYADAKKGESREDLQSRTFTDPDKLKVTKYKRVRERGKTDDPYKEPRQRSKTKIYSTRENERGHPSVKMVSERRMGRISDRLANKTSRIIKRTRKKDTLKTSNKVNPDIVSTRMPHQRPM